MGIEDVIKRIELVQGDITKLKVDAVVNAANTRLVKGGGVDGAIHRAAGPKLAEACAQLKGCPTGQAKVTPGFNLQAKWIIHAVGPVWQGGQAKEEELLASCYHQALLRAHELGAHSVAFPAISTGAYGFPIAKAARIAWQIVLEFLESHLIPQKVIFCLFDRTAFETYASIQEQLVQGKRGILNEGQHPSG